VRHSFSSACKRAGITDFHFHDLRHTFASHLVMAGVDITTVSKLLGHKSLKMTLRYAHLAPAHMAKAVNILDSALSGKISSVGECLLETHGNQLTHKLAQSGVN
jgi:integrase